LTGLLTARCPGASISVVADVFEIAPSGRAKCRGCSGAIAKGAVRFGESFANPYAEGETHSWFHVPCAALMRPEKYLAAEAAADELPAPFRDALRHTAEVGVAHRRLPRLAGAERASSGRAHCRHCRELIAKGAFRLRLQMFEEGRASPIGTIHVACAEPYFGTRDIMDRIIALAPDLDTEDRGEIERDLASEPPARPPLAKTQGEEEPASRKSGTE
jgi:bifunctional polynucleotide phosphatase/kinase